MTNLPRLASLIVAAGLAAPSVAAAGTGKPAPGPRTVAFAGQTWLVKSSTGAVGPGPNRFSSDPASVWVDAQGRLHLKIRRAKGRWYAAEVISTASFGHGTYTWVLDSPVGDLDPNVVLGLFTWNDDPAYAHREIDIEVARWGNAFDPTNAQFVVQPWDAPGHLWRFSVPSLVAPTSHAFTWAADRVDFRSEDDAGRALAAWSFTDATSVPVPGGENARMNLWLREGLAPTDGREVEVVVRAFSHAPLAR